MEAWGGTVWRTAPGVWLLVAGCALIVLASLLTTVAVVALEEATVLGLAVEALAIGLGLVLALVGHGRAKRALAQDPALRGAFLVHHAWWMTLIAAVVAKVVQVPLLFLASDLA